MFVPNILTFASEGRELQYAGIGCPIDKWGPWFADEERKHGTLEDVEHNYVSLMTPERLLDIYRFYSVFTGTSGGRKIKINNQKKPCKTANITKITDAAIFHPTQIN